MIAPKDLRELLELWALRAEAASIAVKKATSPEIALKEAPDSAV